MANNIDEQRTLTFVARFNDAVAYYQGIQSMSVDPDGTIHLFMSTGQEITYTEIRDQFALLETAFVFQGVINSASELPADHKKGWLYLVGTAGQYAGQTCEIGDMIVCINNGTVASNADWTVIQTNLKPEDFIAKATLSTKYDMLYASAAKTPARLAANTTSTRKFLRSGGDSSNNGQPKWDTVTQTDVGLSNVDNTADVDKPVSTAQKAYVDNWMNYTPINISAFSVSPSSAEVGSTVSSVTFNYTMNKVPTSATLKRDDEASPSAQTISAASGSFSKSGLSLTSTRTWTLTANETKPDGVTTASSSKNTSLTFMYRVFYGAAASGTVDSAFVRGLANNPLDSDGKVNFSVTTGANQYIWYASPASKGERSFNVGGFDGGFEPKQTVNVKDAGNNNVSYYVYRSTHPNLGTVSVTVK